MENYSQPEYRNKNQTNINKIGDVLKSDWDALPLLNIVGQKILIKGFEVPNQLSDRKVWVLILKDGTRYYTFSKIIGKQLDLLKTQDQFSKGLVEATVNKVKNYYTLS